MMKFMRETKGYISIFLCLVMLPMVTFASMVIDVSRLQCARSNLMSAGDLTMNAGLSEYEVILQDMYGLFATVENSSDLQGALESYFTKTITSTIGTGEIGEDEYVQQLAENIATAILSKTDYSTTDFTNLIQMQLDDTDDSFKYKGVDKSALANPAVLKQQIIDYMKYKGPVSLACALLSKIKFLSDSSNQTKAVQKKIEYTETLKKLEEPSNNAYEEIVGTDEADTSGDIGYNDYVHTYNGMITKGSTDTDESFKAYVKKTKKCFSEMAEYLYYANQLKYQKSEFDGFSYDSMETISGNEVRTFTEYDNDADQMDKLDSEFDKLIDCNEGYQEELEVYFGDIKVEFETNSSYPDGESAEIKTFTVVEQPYNSANACIANIQSWLVDLTPPPLNTAPGATNPGASHMPDEKYEKMYETQIRACQTYEYLAQFVSYYKTVDNLYNKMDDAWSTYTDNLRDDIINGIDTTSDEYKNMTSEEIDGVVDGLLEDELKTGDPLKIRRHMNVLKRMRDIIRDDYLPEYKKLMTALDHVDYYEGVAENSVTRAMMYLEKYYIVVSNCEAKADKVIELLDKVLVAESDVETASNNWNAAIDNVQDSAMQSNFRNDHDTMTNGVDKDDVVALQNVAKECKSFYGDIKAKIETIKFYDNQVFSGGKDFDISTKPGNDYNNVYNRAGLTESDRDFLKKYPVPEIDTVSAIKHKANDLVNAHFDAGDAENYTPTYGNKLDGKKPQTTAAEPTDDDEKEKFFYTLKSIHNPKPASDSDNSVDKVNKVQDLTEDSSQNYTQTSEGEPKDPVVEEDTPGKVSEDFDKIMAKIKGYTSVPDGNSGIDDKDGGQTKDVNISSDADYESNSGNAKSSLSNAASILDMFKDLAEGAMEVAYLEEYFTEMFTCQTDVLNDKTKAKKLLNGKAISELNANTEWYGNEIEYLIWGDSTLKNNRIKTEAMIFTIRFALNAIYAFTAPDIQAFALEAATAIAGWTVIGVPIVQACITIALAMAESAYDLVRLKNGEDVPIYKNQANFVCSPTGFMKEVVTEMTTEAIKAAANEVTNKINEGVDKIAAYGEKKLGECTDEINELVANYTKEQTNQISTMVKTHFTTPLINKLTPALTLISNGQNNAEDALKTAIDEAFTAIGDNISNEKDGIVKELSLALYGQLGEPAKENLKQEIIGKINGTNFSAHEVTTLINEKVDGWLIKIKGSIDNKVKELTDDLKHEINSHADEAASNIKSIVNEKMTDLSNQITDSLTASIEDNLKDGVLSKKDVTAAGGITLNYKEYCKIFMLINVIADQNKVLRRCAVLVQANVRHASENANGNFEIVKANTLVSIDAKVKMGTLFPWAVSIDENTASGENGVSLDFSHLGNNYVIIDYSAVNGY